jgi:hypothetical protein
MKELLGFDPLTDKAEFYLENGDGEWGLYTEQDCEPTLDLVRAIRDTHVVRPLDFRHVAEVPLVFIDQAFREGWFHDPAAWRRFLNDPERRAFRTWEGRL